MSISSTFYVRIFRTNVRFGSVSSYVVALAKNLYEKRARKMLMKLTVGVSVGERGGVNFTIFWPKMQMSSQASFC